MSPHTAFPCKILNGMMSLRHDDIMTWRPDCMRACQSMSRWWVVCGSKAGGAGVASCFFCKLQRILFKSPPPSRRILTKDFSKTFTKLSLTFTKRGEKWTSFTKTFTTFTKKPPFHPFFFTKKVKKWTSFTFSFTNFHPSPFSLQGSGNWPTFAPSVETNEARWRCWSFIALIAPSCLLRPPAGKVTGQ